jgi:oligoribonuclease
MFAWLDIESEGLDPRKHAILEVGMIVTDDQLVEQARASWVLHLGAERHEYLEPVVRDMHRASGLLDECERSVLFPADVEHQAMSWLTKQGVPRGEVPLCGSTIGFDRRFLGERMPRLLSYFHYRSIDVSTLTELARRWFPEVYAARPGADESKRPHRALADLDASIGVLKHYRRTMLVDHVTSVARVEL